MNGENSVSPRHLWRILVACGLVWFSAFVLFPPLFAWIGLRHYGVWFLDTFALLASSDALARGLDPYSPNPLDYFHRPHVYSHWWLLLHKFGLSRADNVVVGLSLVASFFVAAVARLRPRDPRELIWQLAVLCSPPVLLAMNRGNNDLLVFLLLAPVVPCLLSSVAVLRYASIAFVAIAAALKFYPAAAALVLAAGGGDPRETRLRTGAGAAMLVIVAWSVIPDVIRVHPFLPRADGILTFGAANLIRLIGLDGLPWAAGSLCAAFVGVSGLAGWRLFRGWDAAAAGRHEWLSFVLGAVLLAGCFLAGTNYAYRWIFALWMVPFLWWLVRERNAPLRVRRVGAVTAFLLLFSLWGDALVSASIEWLSPHIPVAVLGRAADEFFKWEQPVTWSFFGCMIAFLAHFIREALAVLCRRTARQTIPVNA